MLQPPESSVDVGAAVGSQRAVAVLHAWPAAHSALVAQLDAHLPSPPQRNGAQGVTVPSTPREDTPSSTQRAPAWHLPASHWKPSAQSAAVVHAERQPSPPQANGTHDVGSAARQLPAPSQYEGGV